MNEPQRFGELAAAFVYLQSSSNTQAAYRSDLTGFEEWCNGADPLRSSTEDIEHYRTACEAAGASSATVARRLSALNSFFDYAASAGAVDAPVQVRQRPISAAQPTATLSPVEINAFIGATALMGAKTVALVHLLLFDGLKLGELLAADAQDVHYARQRVVALTLARRATASAQIALDPRTCRALAVYLAARTTGPLLLGDSPTREPARLTRFGADYLLKRTGDLAGLTRGVSSNVLRRTHVANAHAAGETVDEIQERLGHADARTTQRHLDI